VTSVSGYNVGAVGLTSVGLHEDVLAAFVDGDEAPTVVSERVQAILQGIAPFLVVHRHDLIVDGTSMERLWIGGALIAAREALGAVVPVSFASALILAIPAVEVAIAPGLPPSWTIH
jgi:hypothetical protein